MLTQGTVWSYGLHRRRHPGFLRDPDYSWCRQLRLHVRRHVCHGTGMCMTHLDCVPLLTPVNSSAVASLSSSAASGNRSGCSSSQRLVLRRTPRSTRTSASVCVYSLCVLFPIALTPWHSHDCQRLPVHPRIRYDLGSVSPTLTISLLCTRKPSNPRIEHHRAVTISPSSPLT